MEEFKHLSHDHQLSLFEAAAGEYDDPKPDFCKLCGLPILSSPSYTCTIGCEFWLHKPCALKLPIKLNHSHHNPKHTLCLRERSPNFVYECENCDFRIHPLVAVPGVEIKIKHKSHVAHPLVALCREVSCECDACGREHKGFFFWCGECNFWIHPDCTLLPSIIKLVSFPLPFVLAYSFPGVLLGRHCLICREPRLLCGNGIYFCPQIVDFFAHARCGRENLESGAAETRLELIQLPDEGWDTFPSSTIRAQAALAAVSGDIHAADDNELTSIQKYHNHPLIQLIDHGSERSSNFVCDLCIQPINTSSPILYRCAVEDQGCRFLAHKMCADLLPILKFAFLSIMSEVCPRPSSRFFNSVFYCLFCHRPCNGLCHYFPDPQTRNDELPLFIDLQCMAAPSTIKHASHAHHLLFRTIRLSALTPLTCCPNDSSLYDVYRCILCDFYIHISCAVLPKRVRHELYHHHTLHLVFTTTTGGININGFCEVCEGDIDLKYWLYRCGECDQCFHINCIPSVGYLSKVKFGGTLSLPHCHIDHPLTLNRMLTLPSQRCGYCHQIIQGLVDEMAFSCSHCHFWLHFSCARDSAANPLSIYSDVDDQGFELKVPENLPICSPPQTIARPSPHILAARLPESSNPELSGAFDPRSGSAAALQKSDLENRGPEET